MSRYCGKNLWKFIIDFFLVHPRNDLSWHRQLCWGPYLPPHPRPFIASGTSIRLMIFFGVTHTSPLPPPYSPSLLVIINIQTPPPHPPHPSITIDVCHKMSVEWGGGWLPLFSAWSSITLRYTTPLSLSIFLFLSLSLLLLLTLSCRLWHRIRFIIPQGQLKTT